MATYSIVETGVIVTEKTYCENCQIVPVSEGDKYCLPCLNDIVEYLARERQEQTQVEKGWY